MRFNIRLAVLTSVLSGFLSCGLAFGQSQTNDPTAKPWQTARSVGHTNYDAEIAELTKESFQQSVDNIQTNTDQFFNAAFSSDAFFPEIQLEQVLNCRRAEKILSTVRNLPEKERVLECNRLFDRSLQELENTAFANIENSPNKYVTEPYDAVRVALFATAESGRLDLLAEQYKKVDKFEQRYRELTRKRNNDNLRIELYTSSRVPDNRFQVNTIRLAVSQNPQSQALLKNIDAFCQSIHLRTNEVTVPPWNSWRFGTLTFDEPNPSEKGVTYLLYDWPYEQPRDLVTRNAMNREVVQKLRKMAFQNQ